MKVKMLMGIGLFLIGLVSAVFAIVTTGDVANTPFVATEGNASATAAEAVRHYGLAALAALSLAIGGLLMGLSMGNWKHPRTHLEPGDEVVDPEGYHRMKHV